MHIKFMYFYLLYATTALLVFVTTFLLPMEFITSSPVKMFTKFVASIAPGVSPMALKSLNPWRAELVYSVQWAFFPIYLCALFIVEPIRSKEKSERIMKATNNVSGITKRRFFIIGTIIVLGSLILSDFGVVDGISFVRHSMYLDEVSTYRGAFRAPFTSNFGMAFCAWFSPACGAVIYWFFALLVVNFPALTIRTKRS